MLRDRIIRMLERVLGAEAHDPDPATMNAMERAEAIMAPSQTTVAEMLALKPSTLMGFYALDLAAKWADGQSPGFVPAEGEAV